ncbi:MAG: dienelactone hydrolase family protein [Cryobacterium sp.]|nr:dienelactone hydrolase family protein [Cryobacterium sp.]
MTLDTDAILWSAPEGERAGRPLLVLLHGVGSHEGDLFGLAPYLPDDPVIASLRAPLSYGPGFAWFPMPGEAPDAERFAVARESAASVLAWLAELASADVGGGGVGLLGFSQGAAMTFELLRARPELFDYAVPLSGFVFPDSHPGDAALAERRPPVFWGRGDADELFPPERLAFSQEWIPKHTTLTERVYAGLGHGINQEELGDIAKFLRGRLA